MTDQRSDAPEPALGLSLGQDPETQERFLRLLLRLARRPGGAGLGRGSELPERAVVTASTIAPMTVQAAIAVASRRVVGPMVIPSQRQ